MRLNPKNKKMLAFFNGLKLEKENMSRATKSYLGEIYDAIMDCRDVSLQLKKTKNYVERCPISSSENSYYMPSRIKRYLESTPCRFI